MTFRTWRRRMGISKVRRSLGPGSAAPRVRLWGPGDLRAASLGHSEIGLARRWTFREHRRAGVRGAHQPEAALDGGQESRLRSVGSVRGPRSVKVP